MAKQKAESEKLRADEQEPGRNGEAPEPREEPQAEEEEPESLNCWEASHRVVQRIDGDTTLAELAHDADQLVVAGGGKSNVERCRNTIHSILQSLEELGMVQMTEEVSVHPLHRLPSAERSK
jgi:hypothetical protein